MCLAAPDANMLSKMITHFWNHIIIGNYLSSFSCGKCLEFVASFGQQMKRHFAICDGPKKVHKKKHSKGNMASEAQSSQESAHKSKKGKDKADKEDRHGMEKSKLCRSPSKSASTANSQEQAPDTPHHSKRIAESTSCHHKKSKKCDKKLHKKSE